MHVSSTVEHLNDGIKDLEGERETTGQEEEGRGTSRCMSPPLLNTSMMESRTWKETEQLQDRRKMVGGRLDACLLRC